MSRALRATLLTLVFGAAVTVTGSASAQDKCKLATGESRVGKACTEGGVKKAKEVMKEMVKQGKSAGVKMNCDDCHKDDTHYDQLTADGKEKFKKLLAAIEKK